MLNVRESLIALSLMGALVANAQAATLNLAPLGPATYRADNAAGIGSCTDPQVPARVMSFVADYPALSAIRGDAGTVDLGIALAPNGGFQKAWVIHSSGLAALDSAAASSAAAARYSAEQRNCTAIGGRYLLQVEYTSN